MSVIIKGFNRPKNCYGCRFNDNNCYCSITKGTIDRDDYTCNVLCPIEQLPKIESKDKMTSEYRKVLEKDESYCVYTIDEVLSWMPLPKSYKTESEK